MVFQVGEDALQSPVRNPIARFDAVVAIHQHLRLNDWHQAGLLRQRRIASQGVRVRVDAVLRRYMLADSNDGTPLRELRS